MAGLTPYSVQGYGYTNPELVVVLDHWRQERKDAKCVNILL